MTRAPRRLFRWAFIVISWILGLLIWARSPIAGAIIVSIGLALFIREYRAAQKSGTKALLQVNWLIRDLTRTQVAYLSQSFSTDADALSWLSKALPNELQSSAQSLKTELDQARDGTFSESLRLVQRIIQLRKSLYRYQDALDIVANHQPATAVARPSIFVITQRLADGGLPLVVTTAGWDPQQRTVLPQVDLVTLYEPGPLKQKFVRGQIPFDVLQQHVALLETPDVSPSTFVAPKQPDTIFEDLPLAALPLGFLVGESEFV